MKLCAHLCKLNVLISSCVATHASIANFNVLSLAMLCILYLIVAVVSVLHAKMVLNQKLRGGGKKSSLRYPVNMGHLINKYINMY